MGGDNLILVSIDTLRADVAYSGRFPTIERLRREGTTYLHVVSSSPLTPISHATVLTGLQPARHGIRHLFRETLSPKAVTMQSVFAEQGYQTAAVVSCPGMRRWYGFDRGFGFYDDWIPLLPDGRDALDVVDVKERGLALKRAPDTTARALSWLAARDRRRPFLLFVHYFDTHWPYEPPSPFDTGQANAYEGEVAFVDRSLGELLAGAAAAGAAGDDTRIVVFSDHGEDLAGWYANDHSHLDDYRHEQGHGMLLFDTTQLVPLIVRGAGAAAGRSVVSQVRLVDLAPTLLEWFDLAYDPKLLDGRSFQPSILGSPIADRPGFSETFLCEELAEDSPYRALGLRPTFSVRLNGVGRVIWDDEHTEFYDHRLDPNELSPVVHHPLPVALRPAR